MKRTYIKYVTDEKLEKVNKDNIKIIERYFNYKQTNLSASSINGYKSDFNQLLVYILENYDNVSLMEVAEKDPDEMINIIEDFLAFCRTVLGNNERRIQRRMASISSFFIFLRKRYRNKIKENPLDYLDRPKIGKGEKPQIKQTFLTKEQVEMIRKGLKDIDSIQLTLFFEFALSTMARANAISNVKIEQIDFKNNCVNDVLEKEGYIVTLFPSKKAMSLIKKWLKHRKEEGIESEYLFITKYRNEWGKVSKGTLQNNWIKKIGEIIDIPNLHCHDLRHSGSNLLFHSGMPLEDVSQLLNHKSTAVTQDHYLQIDYSAIRERKSLHEI